MIPLKNMMARRTVPVMTILIIVVNVLVYFHQATISNAANDAFIRTFGLVPLKMQMALAGHRYSLAQAFTPVFTCMFLHGGFLHILGNMWFLWIFGGAVEDRLGPVPYMLFYLVCGIGSGLAQAAFSWGSNVPSIGASGAISGILGAYVVYFPASRDIHARAALHIFLYRADSRDCLHRALVRRAISQRRELDERAAWRESRRSCLVGACRRICAWG